MRIREALRSKEISGGEGENDQQYGRHVAFTFSVASS